MKFASLALLSVLATASHALVIDDFRDGAFDSGEINDASYQNTSSASVPGGSRLVDYRRTSAQSTATYQVATNTNPGLNQGLVVNNGPGVDGTLALYYGGLFNRLNLDLRSTPVFEVNVGFNDLPSEFSVSVIDFEGTGQEITRTAIANRANNGSQILRFDFSDVDPTLLSGIDGITLTTDFPTSNDFIIGSVSAVAAPVPEPASLVALGLGGVALLRRRRKA